MRDEFAGDQFITTAGLMMAVFRLLQARQLARDADALDWQFAVEWKTLQRAGLVGSELRWLLAISLGLSHNFADDHEQLVHGFVMYDALHAWLKHVRDEKHDWNPQRTQPS